MGYVITKETAPWATKREEQLRKSEIDIGAALEELEKVPGDLRAGADLIDDQPESDRIRSFADEVEKTAYELRRTLEMIVDDRLMLNKALLKWGERDAT